ncbi:MAG: succinate dehydrogenase cytochrome b subunit [Acidobacteria bacterium]|jgi:succinate dehydrogenase / fumarate reductase, cytochrome b subunit|nr:succinate dehydrogenase cytochrome b subunit [Acidobacteriota bacterium]
MTSLKALSTSVGSKFLVALTGLSLVGFLIAHLIGNLLLLAGPDTFNAYGHALISNPLVIPAEFGLLGLLLLHIYKALRHVLLGRRARPHRYTMRQWAGGPSRKSWSSTTMAVSGVILLIFLVTHIATFKFGPYYPSADEGVRDLSRLVQEVFSSPGYVVFYVVAMGIIGMHLRHGISSAFQSLGLMTPGWTSAVLSVGLGLAVILAGGFALIPVWVYLFL